MQSKLREVDVNVRQQPYCFIKCRFFFLLKNSSHTEVPFSILNKMKSHFTVSVTGGKSCKPNFNKLLVILVDCSNGRMIHFSFTS